MYTAFTIAHVISLALSAYQIFNPDVGVIEFLIPVTILITALYYLYASIREIKLKLGWWSLVSTIIFGLIHGFGFSNYFNMMTAMDSEGKELPLFGFALGIEIAQLLGGFGGDSLLAFY